MIASEPLPHFVDDLLGYLHETHPTYATLDGVHTHDDLLEDLSRQAIEGEVARADRLPAPARRDQPEGLTPVERLEHRMLASHVRGRMFELEEVRTWERQPAALRRHARLEPRRAGRCSRYAPAAERARRVLSKLRQTPRLIQAARDNIKEPPGIFVKVGIETMRGALKFIDEDLPRAFSQTSTICICSANSPTRRPRRAQAVGRYIHDLETEVAPQARAARSASAARSSSRSCGSKKGIAVPIDRLLAIATRELKDDAGSVQERWRAG